MIERRSNRRARNGRKTPKNVLFVFQNCTFRFADYNRIEKICERYFVIFAKIGKRTYRNIGITRLDAADMYSDFTIDLYLR